MYIKAKGKLYGHLMTIEINGDGERTEFLFDGKKDDFLEYIIKKRLDEKNPVAGTYVADDWWDSINIFFSIKDEILEDCEIIEANGVNEVPYESGVVY